MRFAQLTVSGNLLRQTSRKMPITTKRKRALTIHRSLIVFMLFIVICLLIDILAIVLFMRDALKPGTFLTMNCFQTGFFGGILIMDVIAVAKGTSAAGIGSSVFIL